MSCADLVMAGEDSLSNYKVFPLFFPRFEHFTLLLVDGESHQVGGGGWLVDVCEMEEEF